MYVNAVKRAIARIDKDLPLTRIRTMGDVEREATARPRFRAELVTAFAAVAVVLAAVAMVACCRSRYISARESSACAWPLEHGRPIFSGSCSPTGHA